MRAISTCAVNERRGTNQPTNQTRGGQQSRSSSSKAEELKEFCCRRCQQIATKSSTNHQQQRRPRAPPRASSRVVASSRSSSREPLLLFVSLRVGASLHISPSSVSSVVVVAGGDCPTHRHRRVPSPNRPNPSPLCVGLDTLLLIVLILHGTANMRHNKR